MPKTRYFSEKSCKNRLSVGGSAPNPALASGGWGSAPDPCCFSPILLQLFRKRLVLILTHFITVIRTKCAYCPILIGAQSIFCPLPMFFFSGGATGHLTGLPQSTFELL